MSRDAKLASECFAENLEDYVEETDGEKHNLYKGLRALADALAGLSQAVRSVDAKLDLITQKIQMIS
jgi:hypothetical protein